jgi:tRNA dimethylallyltransferase
MTVRKDGPEAILIAGPTAGGKSASALRLARERCGVVVNVDSMQVYRELRILTARPTETEMGEAPHLLYGHVGAAEPYSVARWLADAAAALDRARAQKRLPIFVGGTGLYFRALLHGLSPVPEIDPEVRRRWRAVATDEAAEALHRRLEALDPVTAARLSPTDTQRIVRALEVKESTGRSLAEWQTLPGRGLVAEARTERLVVMPDRPTLLARCDARFDAMMANGALEEVRTLVALGLDPSLPAMRALGVASLRAHIAGEVDLETAVAEAKRETRRYVRRQMTWLRRNMITWKVIK